MSKTRNIIPNDEHENFKLMIEWIEKSFIEDALRQSGGVIRQARIALKMPRAAMVDKMRRYNINAADFRR